MEPLALIFKSTVLVGLAGVAAALLARTSAAVRHVIWRSAMAALAALPLACLLVPAWRPASLVTQPAAAPARYVLNVVAGESGGEGGAETLSRLWLAWGLVAGLMLAREAMIRWRAARLVRRSEPFTEWEGVRLSAEVEVPAVFGVWRPVIVLPTAARGWARERIELILAHERMHIRRRDPAWLAVGRLAAALWWPQPLVWYALSRLRTEAEHACDDGVIEQGGRPSSYAAHLLEIAAGSGSSLIASEGAVAMITKTELESRLRAVLNPSIRRHPVSSGAAALAVAAAVLLLAPLAALRAPAFAGGTLSGVVEDASGARVPKARVVVISESSSAKEFALTDAAGEFRLEPLEDGVYTVEVRQPGFTLLRHSGVKVSGTEPARLKLTLNVGQISEKLTVSAAGVPAPEPAAKPGESGTPSRIKVGGHMQAAKMVKQVRPVYPADCKASGIQGTVLLKAVIGKDGSVVNLEPLNKLVDSRLVDASLEAVRQWRYEPTLLNGNPVEVITEIEINFTLSK